MPISGRKDLEPISILLVIVGWLQYWIVWYSMTNAFCCAALTKIALLCLICLRKPPEAPIAG